MKVTASEHRERMSYLDLPIRSFRRLGRIILMACHEMGQALIMLASSTLYIRTLWRPRARYETSMQLYITGIKSLGVITVVAMFTGMILALQTGLELRRYGQEEFIGSAVAVSMIREMGPFMTGLIIAASVGSAIAAQLGTMTVSEEIAALEVMSIDPHRFLVMPRLVALAVMMPILTIYTNLIGIFGGGVVGSTQLGVAFQAYLDNATRYAENKDLYVGLLKALVFGVIIATVACHQGLTTSEGAVGVGRATRRTVIISFLLILIVGYMITRLFYI
ncbi:MlaE family ABC transporter permease [Tichowtungia aerotolerans]|uniref:MlaE family lipid ABC transporter permease subunit n=1 Tax=Tichowtungia aerotolerans TaxID=2697043 RepID=A0A6P1M055_9BACT|nr:ABC transporter permease [Tichowtungia aerotolerans]QHI67930.1 MlaE family lipid ABC transporter permease subunit [Tichowtungia aerotolerans]